MSKDFNVLHTPMNFVSLLSCWVLFLWTIVSLIISRVKVSWGSDTASRDFPVTVTVVFPLKKIQHRRPSQSYHCINTTGTSHVASKLTACVKAVGQKNNLTLYNTTTKIELQDKISLCLQVNTFQAAKM